MAERKHIGLYYESYANLPAYVIYVQNLVRTLNRSADELKPHLVILHRDDSPVAELKAIGYPYLEFYERRHPRQPVMKRAVNKLSRMILKNDIFSFADKNFPKNLDVIFPYDFKEECKYVKSKIVWKPDFQEFHLPQYFSYTELLYSRAFMERTASSDVKLVLSSEDSLRDYNRFFPGNSTEVHLWPFTSYLPSLSGVSITNLLERYGIKKKYFLVANQFWPHKNHLNVFKACAEIRDEDFQLVCTGKQGSGRDPELFKKLNFFLGQNKLQHKVIFTGFIERAEQLVLMKNSVGVIQPSTFEGWSTVIEDCKALGQYVLASSLAVNKEQLKTNCAFFDPHDYHELAEKMKEAMRREKAEAATDYDQEIDRFNERLLRTFGSAR
jgi:glycosyltransferase involved in cell wall biosynthesis